ncbi:hypothetical protein MY3957_000193 [Beauveria namnaoensis]
MSGTSLATISAWDNVRLAASLSWQATRSQCAVSLTNSLCFGGSFPQGMPGWAGGGGGGGRSDEPPRMLQPHARDWKQTAG